MSPFSLPAGLWWIVGAILFVDGMLLAAAGRPVALRLQRIGVLCAIALVVRTLCWWVGFAVQSPVELALLAAALAGAIVLLLCGRVWLVRDDLPRFRQQVETAARRLFLKCEESPPGRFELLTREAMVRSNKSATVTRRLSEGKHAERSEKLGPRSRVGLLLFPARCCRFLGSGRASQLRVMVLLPRLLLVVLPRAPRRSKVALLLQWLAKQYSGPIPRLHIVLKRSPS